MLGRWGAVRGESRNRAMRKTGFGGRASARALLVSSRAESPDSKGDFHIMILQQCIAYFKDLITTSY